MHINKISRQNILEIAKQHKRYLLIILVLLVFVARGFFSGSSSTSQNSSSSTFYTVQSGTIENSIKVIGTTKITNQQTLTFGLEGKVTAVYVKEGDQVKAGQLLAEMDSRTLQNSLSQQSLSIQNAKINYNKLLNQYTDADKLQAQNSVDDAQKKLDIAKQELEDLTSDQGKTIQTNGSLAQTNIIFSKSVVTNGKDVLQDIHDVLYGDQKDYISLRSTANRSSAQLYYGQASTYYQQFLTSLSSLEATSTTTLQSIQNLQNALTQFLTSLSSSLDSLISAVNDSLVGVDLSQVTLDDDILTPLKSDNSQVLSMRTSLNSNISSLQNMDSTIQSKQNEIRNDEVQLKVYQDTLQNMLDGPDSDDLILQQNSIKQSQLNLQNISQQLDNYQITAPFDGTIDVVDFKQGDNVDNTQGITISNPDTYQVNVLIDQVDIVKVSKGQEAEITFDAYPGYTVTGSISVIDPTPVEDAGVVSYYARIALKQGEKKVYDSMTVTVNIIIDKKENVLVIPSAAIQSITGDGKMVEVISGSNGSYVPVTVGITDGTNSEIISGLSLGNIISLQPYTFTSSSKTSTSSSSSNSAQSSMSSMRALEGSTSGGPGGGTPPN